MTATAVANPYNVARQIAVALDGNLMGPLLISMPSLSIHPSEKSASFVVHATGSDGERHLFTVRVSLVGRG